MNSMTKLLIGVAAVFASSWVGVVAYSYTNFGELQPEISEETGGFLPPPLPGNAIAGQRVYAANGCVYCHSQQVRPAPMYSDIARGYGTRQTVPRDYMRYANPFTGMVRTGPDLTNVGARQTDVAWYYRHLYEPNIVTPGSVMPAYRFLFEERKIQGEKSELAVEVGGPHPPKEGFEIVPKPEAQILVSYLMSLKRDYPLEEAPAPPEGGQ